MIHTIKVKGCFDCPFRDMENEECGILGTDDFPAEHKPWHGVSIRDIGTNGFHYKCPLHNVKIEVIKVN